MKRVLAILFPGDRRIWLAALIVAIPIAGALAHSLTKQRQYFTGTNTIGTRSLVANMQVGDRICIPQTELPGGTGRVQFEQFSYLPTPALRVEIIRGGRTIASGASRAYNIGGMFPVTAPVAPALPERPAVTIGTVCISPVGEPKGRVTQLGGMFSLQGNQVSPTIDGKPIASRISLWFLPPAGKTRSLLASWPDMMRRIALFRPGFAGPWFYWLLFLVVIPLVGYGALRLLATAALPGRRLVLSLVVLTVVSGGVWAITTVPLDSPDESEHYAYVQSIAEQGRAPDSTQTSRSTYSSDEIVAMEAINHFSQIELRDARTRWLGLDVANWRARVRALKPPSDNGGGYAAGTAAHSPLYYTLLVPAYFAAKSSGFFGQLFWIRWMSSLLSVIVVLSAYAIVRELAPGRRREAVGAALLVAFEPMFGFISGAINNDNGVNAAAALVIYMFVRALRRGLTLRLGLAIGVTMAILPLMKGTGYELFPAALVATLLLVARALRQGWQRSGGQAALRGATDGVHRFFARKVVPNLGGLLATAAGLIAFGVVTAVWSNAAEAFHRSVFTTPGGATPVAGILANSDIPGHLEYIWTTFFPRLWFMTDHWKRPWPFYDIYVKRGFAAFGWYADYFNEWVYKVIVGVIAFVLAGILAALVRFRGALAARWRELLFLALAVLGVFGGVEYAYYSAIPRIGLAEQGRYAFPAIAALAALAVFGTLGFRRRWSVYVLSGLVTAMVGLWAASHVLYLAVNYS